LWRDAIKRPRGSRFPGGWDTLNPSPLNQDILQHPEWIASSVARPESWG